MKKVLILGRPNVGKSSLFNRLIKNRKALVLDLPGVTRDLLKGEACWWGHTFEVWDTGGLIWNPSSSSLSSSIKQLVKEAITQADLIVFVMDAHLGLHEDDKSIFKWIKNKKHLLVANKVDHPRDFESQLSEFYSLGSSFIEAAFEKDENIDQIVTWIIQNSISTVKEKEDYHASILITGQCNVGKSSICNLLLKKNRMITSEKAHTTIDVVDETFEFSGKKYQILDTAGIRKRSRRTEDLEKLSSAKTLSYFHKASLIFLVIDGTKSVARQDIRLFSFCMDRFKTCILIVNKWDLVKHISKEEMRAKVKEIFSFFPELPVVFTSAQQGKGIPTLMKKVNEYTEKMHTRISTSELNRFFRQAIQEAPAPVYGTKNIKFYYLTQVKKGHPSFIIFTNEPKGVTPSYKKFLTKKIQKQFSLQGVPIQTTFRSNK